MEKIITIGNKEINFKASAATNILYKKAFGEDILIKVSSYSKHSKELKKMNEKLEEVKNDEGKTQEEILEAMNELMSSEAFIATQAFSSETLPKLAFIMFLEGNEKIGDIFKKLNEENYLAWLMEYDQDELLGITGDVIRLWQSGAKTTSKSKN